MSGPLVLLAFVLLVVTLAQAQRPARPVKIGVLCAGFCPFGGPEARIAPIIEALERVGLGHRAAHTPSQLSGGQQQRVAIARALVTRPPLILADEPTGNLDSATSMEIMKLLTELQHSGMTIVFVTHEPDIAAYAARKLVLKDGAVISDERQQPILAAAS